MKTVLGKVNIDKYLGVFLPHGSRKNITIVDGDRALLLIPICRNIGENTHYMYDVIFFNNSKGVKINCMSFGYQKTYRKFTYGEVCMEFGLDLWVKNGSYVNGVLNSYTEKQVDVFYQYVEGLIFKHFGVV